MNNFIILGISFVVFLVLVCLFSYDYHVENYIDFSEELTVVSHNYSYVDVLIIIREIIKQIEENKIKNKIHIVANDEPSVRILEKWYDKYSNYFSMIYVSSSEKRNTVSKMIEKIKKGDKVVIFLHRISKSKGIYYVVKELKCPINVVTITSSSEPIYFVEPLYLLNFALENTFSDYSVRSKKIDFEEFGESNVQRFFRTLKDELYVHNES